MILSQINGKDRNLAYRKKVQQYAGEEKKIAEDIQEKLSYPGEVKVHLIREMRVVQYAK